MLQLTAKQLDELENSDDPTICLLVGEIRTIAKDALFDYMSRISKTYLDSTWDPDLEYSLWRAVSEKPTRMTDEEVRKLEYLSDRAGGWWRLAPSGFAEFVSFADWKKLVEDYELAARTT